MFATGQWYPDSPVLLLLHSYLCMNVAIHVLLSTKNIQPTTLCYCNCSLAVLVCVQVRGHLLCHVILPSHGNYLLQSYQFNCCVAPSQVCVAS